MSVAKASPKPASVTKQSDLERNDRIADLVLNFGWFSVPNAALSDTAKREVDEFLDECDAQSLSKMAIPAAFWSCVKINGRVLKYFRNETDAKAVAIALMPHSQALFEWIAEKSEPSMETIRWAVSELPLETSTPAGAVFSETFTDGTSLWIGRKSGQSPYVAGDDAIAAVASIFAIDLPKVAVSLRRDEPAGTPAVKTPPRGKSKQPKLVPKKATPEAVADDSDGGRSVRGANNDFELRMVPIEQLQPAKKNHRKIFDKVAMTELADSIKAHGVLQPLLLRRVDDASSPVEFTIIAGERRWRAAQQAGLKEVPAQIVEREGVSESLAMLHENIIRVDLNPIERAQAMRQLMDEHSLSQKEVGQMVGCQQGQISNELRLLNLPESLQKQVAAGELAPTLIRVVLPVAEFPTVMDEIAQSIDKAKQAAQTIDQTMLQNAMREAVKKHSRPMSYESGWQQYSNPNPKDRHFSKTTPEQEKQFDVQEFKFLHAWENQRRTFNLALFDELNKKPLASRREKHRQWKEENSRSTGPKEKTSSNAKPFENHYRVSMEIRCSLVPLLADVLESAKDKQKVRAVCLSLMTMADGLAESISGKGFGKNPVPDLVKCFDVSPAELDKLLRDKLAAELRRDYVLESEEAIALAKALGVDLLQLWKPTDEVVASLTDHGRELLAAAAGSIPEFLLPFFGIEPKKPAKAKKLKAA